MIELLFHLHVLFCFMLVETIALPSLLHDYGSMKWSLFAGIEFVFFSDLVFHIFVCLQVVRNHFLSDISPFYNDYQNALFSFSHLLDWLLYIHDHQHTFTVHCHVFALRETLINWSVFSSSCSHVSPYVLY